MADGPAICPHCQMNTLAQLHATSFRWCNHCGALVAPSGVMVPTAPARMSVKLDLIRDLLSYKELADLSPFEAVIAGIVSVHPEQKKGPSHGGARPRPDPGGHPTTDDHTPT